jgi:hypothetical protein
MSHRFSLGTAIVAGLYAGIAAPGERLFELTMRAMGIVGSPVVLLALIWSVVVIFVAMLVAYGIARFLLDAVLRRWRGSSTTRGWHG